MRSLFRRQSDYAGDLFLNRDIRDVDQLIPDRSGVHLFAGVRPLVQAVLIGSSEVAADLVGAAPLGPEHERLLRLLARSGTRIRGVNDVTRVAVRRVLVVGNERGYSTYQIARGVARDQFRGIDAVVRETYRNRAETIARTEVATASQQAAHDRYKEAGVTHVDIDDGPGCGWTSHNDPDIADGSRRTLQEVEAYPLSHPNCVRVSLPVTRESEAYRT